MQKKQYILTVLSRLENYRGLAKPLYDLIRDMEEVDNAFIDGIAEMLIEAVHDVHTTLAQDKLLQSQKIIKKIQSQSEKDDEILDQELDELLKNL